MPSPSNAFQSFTNEELAAALVKAKTNLVGGAWNSVSGGAKSGSKTVVDPMQLINEINAEMRRRGLLPARPNRIIQKLFPNNYGIYPAT